MTWRPRRRSDTTSSACPSAAGGQFSVDVLDVVGRRGHLSLRNSVFALEAGAAQGKRVCYMFEGFVTGAFRYLLEDSAPASTVTCREAQCVAEGNHEHCRFDVEAGPS